MEASYILAYQPFLDLTIANSFGLWVGSFSYFSFSVLWFCLVRTLLILHVQLQSLWVHVSASPVVPRSCFFLEDIYHLWLLQSCYLLLHLNFMKQVLHIQISQGLNISVLFINFITYMFFTHSILNPTHSTNIILWIVGSTNVYLTYSKL